jgi:FkbM family methyltransferase
MASLSTVKYILNHPLNRDQKLSALRRYLQWEIGRRLMPGPMLFHWVNGTRAIVDAGEDSIKGSVFSGLMEFVDMAYVLHVLRPEDVFVDVGANVGSYTLLACGAIGANGFAFEPVPETFTRLMDNLRLNNITERVQAMNIGISNKQGELFFTADENCTNHVLSDSDAKAVSSIRVPTMSLDAVLSEASPTFIKIDVEGFELPVIEGAQDILTKPSLHSVIMELNGSGERYGFKDEQLLSMMKQFGFSTYSYDPWKRKLINLHGKKNEEEGNTLFIRNDTFVNERLINAQSVTIGTTTL